MPMLEAVAMFHATMGFYPHVNADKSEVDKKRINILEEEIGEVGEAIQSGDRASILHECMDALYVVFGALHEQGFTQSEVDCAWALVHNANMAKVPPKSPMKKAKKGDGWKKADVSAALGVSASFQKALVSFIKGGEISNSIFDIQGELTRTAILNIQSALDDATIISISRLDS